MLTMATDHRLQMVAEALERYPLEGCGVLIGRPGGDVVDRFVPIHNEAASSRIYRLDGAEFIRAAAAADDDGLDIIGVMHSHTATAAYPSPTDVAAAAGPLVPASWHWVIVGFDRGHPELRSFRIVDGEIEEEPVVERPG